MNWILENYKDYHMHHMKELILGTYYTSTEKTGNTGMGNSNHDDLTKMMNQIIGRYSDDTPTHIVGRSTSTLSSGSSPTTFAASPAFVVPAGIDTLTTSASDGTVVPKPQLSLAAKEAPENYDGKGAGVPMKKYGPLPVSAGQLSYKA